MAREASGSSQQIWRVDGSVQESCCKTLRAYFERLAVPPFFSPPSRMSSRTAGTQLPAALDERKPMYYRVAGMARISKTTRSSLAGIEWAPRLIGPHKKLQ